MKHKIATLIRNYEHNNAQIRKRNERDDQHIVSPDSGYDQQTKKKAKERIKQRRKNSRRNEFIQNKIADNAEGSRLTRFQFRVKMYKTFISSQIARVKDKTTGIIYKTQKDMETRRRCGRAIG